MRHKYLVHIRPFSGAKVSYMIVHNKPTLRDDKQDHIILHQGINDLRSENISLQIAKSFIERTMCKNLVEIQ